MRFLALACDYDGTLAHHGAVDDVVIAALERLKQSGRRLVLVTGRQYEDLRAVFPRTELFDRIVTENGAVLVRPAEKEERLLAEPPPESFIRTLREHKVEPLSIGRVIVATWTPHEGTVLRAIRDLGLELQIIFNKGAVMVLPAGVTKATGLTAALQEIGISRHNVAGVGDAENDHALLAACECGVAVQNALPALKERADLVTNAPHGFGVLELCERLLKNDLEDVALDRHRIPLGVTSAGVGVSLAPYARTLLVAGSSGGGKSTFATAFVEKLAERGYQFCVIDPEGDYTKLADAVVIGDPGHAPTVTEALEILGPLEQSAVVNLIAVALEERPAFFEALSARLLEMRARTGRPHFIVVDEAHHMLTPSRAPSLEDSHPTLRGALFLTVHPDQCSPRALALVDDVVIIGKTPKDTMAQACASLGEIAPVITEAPLPTGDVVLWSRKERAPYLVHVEPPRGERLRHRRKYAEGELGADRSFYFRGVDEKLNLRAHNLMVFMRLADGIDDETWLHHLQRGDYATWFRDMIKDDALASAAEAVAAEPGLTAAESRAGIRSAIDARYTLPAKDAPVNAVSPAGDSR